MTVKELIDKLKEFDENKDIFIEDSYYGELAVTTIKNDDNDVVLLLWQLIFLIYFYHELHYL